MERVAEENPSDTAPRRASETISSCSPFEGEGRCLTPSAETRSLLESIPVEFEPGQLEFDLPKEILEVAAEIADVSDVVGLERARLERLVRVVIAMDRLREGR